MSVIVDWDYLFVFWIDYNSNECFFVNYYILLVYYDLNFYVIEAFYEFNFYNALLCYFYILVIYMFNLLEYNYLHLFNTYC